MPVQYSKGLVGLVCLADWCNRLAGLVTGSDFSGKTPGPADLPTYGSLFRSRARSGQTVTNFPLQVGRVFADVRVPSPSTSLISNR